MQDSLTKSRSCTKTREHLMVSPEIIMDENDTAAMAEYYTPCIVISNAAGRVATIGPGSKKMKEGLVTMTTEMALDTPNPLSEFWVVKG
ncbi:hypothetical protein M0802_003121 [Mischocyttarus mexicanus]|nr:hypothetical protein M0802_003121 [Mischocyttarus mexicanus]